MRSLTLIIGLACLERTRVEALKANHTADAQDALDNLIDKVMNKLVDRLLNVEPTLSANLFAKVPRSIPFTIPYNPLNPTSSNIRMRKNLAPTRSLQAWAGIGRREAFLAGLASLGLTSQAGPASADLGSFAAEKAGQFLAILQGSGGATAPAAIQGSGQLMAQKGHGTCIEPVQQNLRWKADRNVAERIDCYNRDFAEYFGYWERTGFLSEEQGSGDDGKGPVTFYDSVTGKPLFVAPQGRSWEQFVAESKFHGWPSFRDNEVVMENVRVLPDGETVSVDGTHLGHNLPDGTGNRYCINLVSVAGQKKA